MRGAPKLLRPRVAPVRHRPEGHRPRDPGAVRRADPGVAPRPRRLRHRRGVHRPARGLHLRRGDDPLVRPAGGTTSRLWTGSLWTGHPSSSGRSRAFRRGRSTATYWPRALRCPRRQRAHQDRVILKRWQRSTRTASVSSPSRWRTVRRWSRSTDGVRPSPPSSSVPAAPEVLRATRAAPRTRSTRPTSSRRCPRASFRAGYLGASQLRHLTGSSPPLAGTAKPRYAGAMPSRNRTAHRPSGTSVTGTRPENSPTSACSGKVSSWIVADQDNRQWTVYLEAQHPADDEVGALPGDSPVPDRPTEPVLALPDIEAEVPVVGEVRRCGPRPVADRGVAERRTVGSSSGRPRPPKRTVRMYPALSTRRYTSRTHWSAGPRRR